MSKKIKVTFILPTLHAGGAEKVMSYIAQNLNKTNFDVTLLIIGYESESRFDIEGINLVFFNKSRVLNSVFDLLLFLRKTKPNIVISAIGHLNILMSFITILFPKMKFIAREVNVISVLKNHSDQKQKINYSFLTTISYKLFDKIICQSNDMKNDLVKNYKIVTDKIIVINNPISDNFKLKEALQYHIEHTLELITVGRLAKQKGHLRILEALSYLNIPFKYTMIGDGPEKDIIFKRIKELKLESNIVHIPFTKSISQYLSESDVFIQGSFVEGFPNALIESCAVGTPVIAFNAPGGIDEIVQNEINGFIVDSVQEMKEKIELIYNDFDRWNDPIKIRNTVYDKYNSAVILTKYESLFKSLSK